MLDPLAALSVASSAVQLIEFSAQFVKRASKVYNETREKRQRTPFPT
jgi:hypothetical protein